MKGQHLDRVSWCPLWGRNQSGLVKTPTVEEKNDSVLAVFKMDVNQTIIILKAKFQVFLVIEGWSIH